MAISDVTLTKTPSGAIDEGSSLSLRVQWTSTVVDHEVRIFWGDDTFETNAVSAAGSYDETYPHVYDDNGEFDILVEVFAGVDFGNAGETITVNNVPPNITSATGTLNNDTGAVSVAIIFTDPGNDTFTGSIDWGDGVTTQHAVLAGTDPGLEASHTYTSFASGDEYRRTITATITDSDGESDSENIWPNILYNEEVDGAGVGNIIPYGIMLYNDEVDKIAVGSAIFNGTPFYLFDADDAVSSDVDVVAVTDYTSVFIVPLVDVECKKVGTIPFEELIPPV